MKIINKINPRISAFKFKDEVRGFLINSLLKNEKILAFYPNCSLDEKGHSAVGWNIKGQRIMGKHGHSPISFSRH
ncbi:hypothetical protein [Hungatella effluvii]|uniref:hypothetical protein n=1 Tax=Hungatella effluvii TaxID=1096246 RepID=UPI002A7F19A1|nr:hypothetical protein [Hungatella effluvii]